MGTKVYMDNKLVHHMSIIFKMDVSASHGLRDNMQLYHIVHKYLGLDFSNSEDCVRFVRWGLYECI